MKKLTFIKRTAAAVLSILFLLPAAGTAAVSSLRSVVPIGLTAGIKMSTEGIIVAGISEVETEAGKSNPAGDAGLQPGDVLLSADGIELTDGAALRQAIESSGGNEMTFEIKREDQEMTVKVKPVKTADGWKIGILARDSIMGIGTITYYDPSTGLYAALGHGVNDSSMGGLMSISGGELIKSTVDGVTRGKPGEPGELHGSFNPENTIGTIEDNTPCGIYGTLYSPPSLKALPVAEKSEIELGPATILANVDGDTVEEYKVNISALYSKSAGYRDMQLEVTDPQLIELTGGIVQGMSGSPVLQNGKIVGAVTHVLVGDPLRGYAIYVGNMLDNCRPAKTMAAA